MEGQVNFIIACFHTYIAYLYVLHCTQAILYIHLNSSICVRAVARLYVERIHKGLLLCCNAVRWRGLHILDTDLGISVRYERTLASASSGMSLKAEHSGRVMMTLESSPRPPAIHTNTANYQSLTSSDLFSWRCCLLNMLRQAIRGIVQTNMKICCKFTHVSQGVEQVEH